MFGTLLSPLHPLLQLFGPMLADAGTDEPDLTRQPSDAGHADTITDDEIDNGDPNDDQPGNDDEPDDDDDDQLAADEIVRRNAARKISKQSDTLRASDMALISLLAEAPSKAPRIIAMLQEESPEQAQRLARMFQKGDSDLAEKLKNADPLVREAMQEMSKTLSHLTEKTEQQRQSEERRTYLTWQEKNAPFLSPKSPEGKTPMGKKLHAEFMNVLDSLFPEDQPLTDDMLADALAVAKRRSNWHSETVKQAVDRQAAEQAQRARTGSAPRSGAGIRGNDLPNVDPSLAKEFGHDDKDRLAKVAEHKKRLLGR